MPKRLILTIIFLRINTIIYTLAALCILLIITTSERRVHVKEGLEIFALVANLPVGFEVIIHGLKKLKFWAWVVALLICGIFLFSILAPLAGLGLWGLLDSESRAAFLRQPGNRA
jgi:hypothetical protein